MSRTIGETARHSKLEVPDEMEEPVSRALMESQILTRSFPFCCVHYLHQFITRRRENGTMNHLNNEKAAWKRKWKGNQFLPLQLAAR